MNSPWTLAALALFLVSLAGGMIAWTTPVDGPAAGFHWGLRVASLLLGVWGLLLVVIRAWRSDAAPDLLRRVAGRHFGRGGVLWAFDLDRREDVCRLLIYYQNRYRRPARATVVVQPSADLPLARAAIDPVVVQIPCGPAAYGVVRVPLAVQEEYQGTKLVFEVAASVDYPHGTGRLLRHRVGDELSPANIPGKLESVSQAQRVPVTGGLPLSQVRPSRVRLAVPRQVTGDHTRLPPLEHDELWHLDAEPA